MTKPSVARVVSTLKADKRYKRLLDTFNTAPLYQIPCETLHEEVKTIHSLREIRRLNPREEGFADNIVKANTHDQAQRSRVVEIMMRCTHVSKKLSDAMDALRNHFLMEYHDHLKQFRTKEERNIVMNMALRKFVKYVDEIENLKEVCLLVIGDIDRGAWSLKNNIEVLRIHSSREMQV